MAIDELITDSAVYALTKQVLAMAKVQSVSRTSMNDVIHFAVADSIYIYGVKGGKLDLMATSGMGSAAQKAVMVSLTLWLWNMLVRKDRGGLLEIALTVGGASLVSEFVLPEVRKMTAKA